jgi:predicted O-methyltransferase YrrM
MFSIPINQKLTESQFNEFYNFCAKNKDVIYDLYFTSRMPPFMQDAMGDIITLQQDAYSAIEAALHIQNTLGIRVSATFNNIKVPPTQKNLDLFILNFKQLYDAGIRSATIPHTHWVATGQIQRAFPELLIKNTILRNVSRPNEIAVLAEAGFHYINLDRDLMRDRDALIECRRAADKFKVKLSLLGNEGCVGNCSMMDEHFEFNNSRVDGPAYFYDPISRVSCPKWSVTDPSTPLKTANIPPWREDWVELLQYVDVFKMHGRESINQIFSTMDVVNKYVANEDILFDEFKEYIKDTNLEDNPINAWRKIIKNCKFNCWDCNFCDKVYEKKSGETAHPLVQAVVNELVDSVSYGNNIQAPGLTSMRVQNLLFGLGDHVKSYLEIGSAMGATASAAGSNDIEVHCIDNWQGNIQPENENLFLPVNTRTEFEKHTAHIKNKHVHQGDFLSIDTSNIRNIDLMFYDGPHDADSTRKAVAYYKECLSDVAIIIFDDANWQGVVAGADAGVGEAGLTVMYSKLILNNTEDKTMWWNGLYILVVKK